MSENYYNLAPEKVIEGLDSSKEGLSGDEVEKRLEKYGFNKIERVRRFNPFLMFLSQFKDIMVIILIIGMFLSFFLGEVVDAVAIGIIILLNAVLGFVQEYKAEKAIEALQKMTSPKTLVIRDGRERRILAERLVPGDIVVLEEGENVPADARLIECFNIQTVEASLTGESSPIVKQVDSFEGDHVVSERKNMVFMGTVITKGHGKGVVVHTGMDTEFGEVAHMVQTGETKMTPLQKSMGDFSKMLALFTVILCFFLFFISFFIGNYDLNKMLLFFMSLAVAVIPEGLPAVITLTLALGVQRIAKKNGIIRNLPAAETLGSTSIICSDKTGTITKNEMTVKKIWVNDKKYDVSGSGYAPEGDFLYDDEEVNPENITVFDLLLKTGVLCNNSKLIREDGKWDIIGDPTEGCLLTAAEKAGYDLDNLNNNYLRKDEIVFDSDRKRMSTINKYGDEITAFTKGGVESVLSVCNKVMVDGSIQKLSEKKKKELLKVNNGFADDALRVLGFSYKKLDNGYDESSVEENMVFLGMMGMIDPPHEEVSEAIEECRNAGIDVIMITGDNEVTARSIGKQIGLYEEGDKVLTGSKLEKMSDEELSDIVEDIVIYARVSPKHKVRILEAIQDKDYVVAMTGDGVNDAPALKIADIGVAMGISGTDVSKEAAEMILADDNFATIVVCVREGRIIFDNIKKFIRFLLSANFGEVLTASIVFLMGFPIPFLPLQILWINLLTDGPPAIALGVDVGEEDIMKSKPRDPKKNIIKEILPYSSFAGLFAFLIAIYLFLGSYNTLGVDYARTLVVTTFVVFEMLLVFSARYRDHHYFTNFFKNKYLLGAVLLSLILHLGLVYIPFMQNIFGTVALSFYDLGRICVLCSLSMVFIEFEKVVSSKLFS